MRRQFIIFFISLATASQSHLVTPPKQIGHLLMTYPFLTIILELGVFLSLRNILWLFSVVSSTLIEVSSLEQLDGIILSVVIKTRNF